MSALTDGKTVLFPRIHQVPACPFSCKGRRGLPELRGRRMTARAAYLVDDMTSLVPARQWVLTLPFRLRYLLTSPTRPRTGVMLSALSL